MKRTTLLFLLVFSLNLIDTARFATAQDLPSIADKTSDMDGQEGYFDVYWDENKGKVWLKVSRFDEDFLYVNSQPAGLGSNDIGLDRNQLGGTRIVRFERVGPKVLLVAPNMNYRALSDNAAERKAVEDAFAPSILWGFQVEAESGGTVLIDATEFIVRDAQGVASRLKERNQGTYSLDTSRSAPYPKMIKSFPKNTEMEARLTFTSDDPGRLVGTVAADSRSVTLRVRHSFIKLPPPGYTPRKADPRSGFNTFSYADYATPIGTDIRKRFIRRHRLQKVNPDSVMSAAVEPIMYYLDPGTPEPVRSALLEGARWWNEAFEAAGYIDAFRVEMLPEDADPMDVRYNMINWVHRSTRGWSYGSSVSDPRTGEIIKGNVSLGSLRVRQNYLLAEGLLAPYRPLRTNAADQDPMLEMALARIRQLSAHEVGHTLGLQHNFAASVNDRASVMDYPAPLATLNRNGRVVLTEAYDEGIGKWDEYTIRYGYSDFPDGTDENLALATIIEAYTEEGIYFITDTDARPAGAANPRANLWDNGENVISSLKTEMRVRAAALDDFGAANIQRGQPMAMLEEVLVPLYLHHRYQINATVKMIGGVYYTYNLRGDGQPMPEPVGARQQRQALDALLETLSPAALALPSQVRTMIPPRPPGYGPHRELFGGYTGVIFDPYAPAEVLASQVLGLIVNPQRTARLVNQNDFNGGLPNLSEVLVTVSQQVWESDIPNDPYYAELQRLVQQVWTDVLLEAASNSSTSPAVRARVNQHLREIHIWIEDNPGASRDQETKSHRYAVFDQIDRFLFRDYEPTEKYPGISPPPGDPIGSGESNFIQRQIERRSIWNEWWGQLLF
ncbi:MAG: zinc-dependent metalloprotease [Rhodothermia bacterium]|nr:MAG: zinc-dependent metalloprotease [Rhodothermia bacterium]